MLPCVREDAYYAGDEAYSIRLTRFINLLDVLIAKGSVVDEDIIHAP